jgi:hypothetical protein
MKLYHFCREKDLDSIAEKGLYPHIPKGSDGIMSLYQPVVWLTAPSRHLGNRQGLTASS